MRSDPWKSQSEPSPTPIARQAYLEAVRPGDMADVDVPVAAGRAGAGPTNTAARRGDRPSNAVSAGSVVLPSSSSKCRQAASRGRGGEPKACPMPRRRRGSELLDTRVRT